MNFGTRAAVPQAALGAMLRAISHRGPDDEGLYIEGHVALGYRRLSIIDVGGSRQPLFNETGDIVLVFNGEIWNYVDLRTRLVRCGHQLRTNGDGEAIVHLYEDLGERVVDELDGMFAFALFDRGAGSLLLGRDRVGKKPLYYARAGADLVFGSEIKSLLCDERVARTPSLQSIADFMSFRYVPGPATMFEQVEKVQPGHTMRVDESGTHSRRYWQPSPLPPITEPRQIKTDVRRLVTLAVQKRLMSDVPVGVMLSGGMDSSLVLALASQASGGGLDAFTAGFELAPYDELRVARRVAALYGARMNEVMVREADMVDRLERLTWHRDDPVSEPSEVPAFLVSELARGHVKVLLTGEGGDEVFAGYPKYAYDWLGDLPRSARTALGLAARVMPARFRRFRIAAGALETDRPERWVRWFGAMATPQKMALLSPLLSESGVEPDPTRVVSRHLSEWPSTDPVSQMLYVDLMTWLPDNLLMKGDKMSMAASIEARLPLLDRDLVEYMARVPGRLKIHPFRSKALMRSIFSDVIPEEVLRRRKNGFAVPVGEWMRRGRLREMLGILDDTVSRGRGYFDQSEVDRLLQQHATGVADHRRVLFTLLALELWHRVFVDSLPSTWSGPRSGVPVINS